jgi:predicted lipoprotein with Yx(FWY)xxD motif
VKSGAMLGLGAVCAALLVAAATSRFWLPHAPTSSAVEEAPLATPPGITMQVVDLPEETGSSAPEIVFADVRGMTLYTYARDTIGSERAQAVAACTGECAKTWRPALTENNAEAAPDWSVLRLADGAKQWCYRGAPLYTFAGDQVSGDIKGQGSGSGAWRAAAFLPEAGMALPGAITARHLPDAGGTALASPEGLALYVFDADPARPPPGWRPLEAGAIASSSGDFTVIARHDGITQWAYRGHPLYLFEGDRKPGEVRGMGVDERFHVALIRRYFMPADATIRWITGLGNALVMRSGATLYERDRIHPGEDNHDFHSEHSPPGLGRWYGTSTCDSSCAKTWPPYGAPATAVASGYWEVFTRPDGGRQWGYKGFALYRYSGDAPGEARGSQRYELVRIDDAPREQTAGEARAPLQLSAAEEAAYVKFIGGGTTAGVGVGALYWHAVAP